MSLRKNPRDFENLGGFAIRGTLHLMFNPIAYLLRNISWYAPIYNLAWALFMLYALILPPLLLWIFKLPFLVLIQPSNSWGEHLKTYRYLLGAAFVIFAFRLIPYWIFYDKILHFLGGGIGGRRVFDIH